ncbi:hypothetical protein CHLRE_14g631850v5 [Chlamydomonas reinhardtii]|uniref:Uncharacterized protein n=1 Tax=Chlamydomonas reinhardtii TaxID=3055 RepID=A0A2K3CYR9_CHLRE|nr:uncharacterized protein CHLRE_14g631850v5 [Chlamydomonas reinhardtii]PNW73435.1 hypothetical protein CHLRE_14g631850v5 [Chlamydomonas reinhardtii]
MATGTLAGVPTSQDRGAAPTADRLWLFDFDYTIVDDNSDTWIHRCAPGGQLPSAVRDSYVAPDWIGYMNRVLSHLAGATERTNGGGTGGGVAAAKDKQGDAAAAACVSPDAIRAELEGIPWTHGMRRLLEAIRDSGRSTSNSSSSSSSGAAASQAKAATANGTAAATAGGLAGVNHAAILSDANSLFIPWILDGGGGGGSGSSSHGDQSDDLQAANGAAAAAAADVAAVAAGAAAAAPPQGQGAGRLPPLSPMFTDIITNPAAVEAGAGDAAGNGSSSSGQAAAAVVAAATAAGGGGVIRVYPHHGSAPQCAAPPHACRRCHANLCKREAMRQLLQRRAAAGFTYRQVVYVGDGRNDLCPCLALGPHDVAMPRVGFALQKLLAAAAATTATATAAPATAPARSAAPPATATGPGGGNDDFIYAAAPAAAPLATAAPPPPAKAAAGPDPEPLLAAVVPWRDAFEILAWAVADDRKAAEAAAARAAEAVGLAESAAGLKL